MVNSRFNSKRHAAKLNSQRVAASLGYHVDVPNDRVYNLRTSTMAQFIRFAIVSGQFAQSARSRADRVRKAWENIPKSIEPEHHGRLA